MLGAHGLVYHLSPRLYGCLPVWRIGLHLRQKARVDSPLLQQPRERSLCVRCYQPRNEHKRCWARPGREAAMFTVAGLFPLEPVMLLMPCHMLLRLMLLKMFFNFVFVLSFGCFDGSPEIVTGLFPIISVSGFKGRCPCWQGWSNIAVNPRFLVGVDVDGFGRNYIIYTLPDETCYGIWIRLYVVIRRCPEHVPVHCEQNSPVV